MQKKKGKRINFKILHCSSEDPEYPASQLLQQSPQSKGWLNKRFPQYPQTIVFQLFETSVINKIAVLSHQSKIATKVQFEIKVNQSDDWKKLGRISLDSNQNTNYQARELKQANINDVQARFIKMVLRQNHVNASNLFNQIGIISLSFYGYGSQDLPPIQDKHIASKNNMETDTATLNRIKELQAKKKKAVEQQNYDLAKDIKDQIDRLKNVAVQITSLEERKQQAIRRQNYDDAKVINEEIKKLRQGGNTQNFENQRQPKPINRNQIRKYSQQETNNVSPISNNPKNAPVRQPQPLQQRPRPEKMQKKEQFQQRNVNNAKNSKEQEDRPIIVKNQNPYGQQPQEQQEVKGESEAQPLNKQLYDECSQYFSVLDEQIFRYIFSKSHTNRQKGVEMVLSELRRTKNRQEFIGACLFVVKNLIDDKIASVLVAAIGLMLEMMKKLKPQASSYNQPLLDFILEKMSDYIGHMNDKVRQTAEEVYSDFPIYHLIEKQNCYRALTSLGKRQKPPKILSGRMNMITKMIKNYQLGRDYQDVIKYAVKYADDKNNEVRSGAINVLCAIAGEIGYNTLQPFLKNLRPPIIKSIEQKLDETGNMQYPNLDQKPIKPKTSEKGAPRGKHSATQIQGGNQFIEIPKKTMNKLVNEDEQCQFCKRIDKRFVEEDYKDMHYFNACPMLIICSQCGQGIEISTLTSHLVGECANSKYYKKCARCKEAVHQKTYKAHAQKKECLSAKPLAAANRCPLCHLDINPGVNGWKQHLVDQGCQNNPRA